jgi:hypothetical protein
MRLLRKLYVLTFGLIFSVSAVAAAAQADCPAIVQQALAATADACADTGRNQACYGNINLSATAQEGVSEFDFSQPGDLVDVAGVQTLTLSPLDEQQNMWGVALLKVQANLPDTLPGQNVTFLLFGDVEIQNAVTSNTGDEPVSSGGVTLDVTISSPTPLLPSITPSAGEMPVLLDAGTEAVADGRVLMGQMIHIVTADGRAGWVPAALVTVNGDINSLPEFDINGEPIGDAAPQAPLAPMQAFYFKTGLNDSPCAEAPDSGILIQTPEGAGKIDFVINDVEVSLGSTGYFQAQPGGDMTISVVEGEGEITSEGETVVVPAGAFTTVPVDEDLRAAGAPEEPAPYDGAELAALPVTVLPQAITIAPPAAEATPFVASAPDPNAVPVPGQWVSTSGVPQLGGGCDPMFASIFSTQGAFGESEEFIMPEGDFSLEALFLANSDEVPANLSFGNPSPGIHTMDFNDEGTSGHYEFIIVSSTRIEAVFTLEFEGCAIVIPYVMEAVNG